MTKKIFLFQGTTLANMLVGGLLCMLYLSSCSSKQILTHDLKESAEAAGIDMKNIQYYTDHRILLSREISSSSASVRSGKVKFKQGKYINIIKIRKGTPGICTSYDTDQINISFEQGSKSSLSFILSSSDVETIVGCANGGYRCFRHVLSFGNMQSYLRNSYCFPFRQTVEYNGEIYYADNGSAIKIKKNIFRKTKVKKERLRGRKLKNITNY